MGFYCLSFVPIKILTCCCERVMLQFLPCLSKGRGVVTMEGLLLRIEIISYKRKETGELAFFEITISRGSQCPKWPMYSVDHFDSVIVLTKMCIPERVA